MNLGMPEMIFIFLLALVIFGPRKLPELGKQLGKALAEFKKASNEFKSQLEVEMMNIELEERAKKPEADPASGRTISPVEKLFDTISGPPGAVSRGSLEPYNGPAITEPGAKEAIAPAPEILGPKEPIQPTPEKSTLNPMPQPAHDA
jgi:TatA/E family protein of Tat protein translocase